MHTFAQNQNQPGKPRSAGFARAGRQTEQQVSEPARLRITSLEPRGLGHAAAPPIVHEQAQTSPGIFETNPLFLENQSPGATWNFSKVPVYPLGLRNGVERSSPAPTSRLPGPIQRKLKVGAIDDPLEHEADRVANQVMRMPASDAAITSTPPQVSRKCDSCKEEEKLQKKVAAPRAAVGNAPASVHKTLNSPGQPLDSETRAFFEPRFGSDFSRVRIHADSPAAESADSVQARAYTVGHHVAFARDQFAPGTADGRHLLAHELAHVVQQASADAPLVQRGPPGAGGQSGQKFFDPSRGPMIDAEKAKLLALRRSLHLPDTPTESDTSIVGILVTETGEEIPFNSSERGGYFGGVRPGDVKGGPGSSTNRYNRTHVETWAANAMRQRGLKRAVLLIELEPCAVCGGYQRGQPAVDTKVPSVSGQLPEDAQLIVVDGQSASYFRQTPTDPQRPARVTPKPPDDPSGSKDEPGGAGTGKSPKSGGEGGTEVEPGSAGKTGGTTPAPKTTGEQPPAPKTPPKAPSGEPPQVKATG